MKEAGELFYYDFDGNLLKGDDQFSYTSTCASEVKLPAPSKSKRIEGKCCYTHPAIPHAVKIGDIVDVAFGDPVILKGCELVSRRKQDVPAEVRNRIGSYGSKILTFRYKGGKVWVDDGQACLLYELKKKK
jgi:hypothetical protein